MIHFYQYLMRQQSPNKLLTMLLTRSIALTEVGQSDLLRSTFTSLQLIEVRDNRIGAYMKRQYFPFRINSRLVLLANTGKQSCLIRTRCIRFQWRINWNLYTTANARKPN